MDDEKKDSGDLGSGSSDWAKPAGAADASEGARVAASGTPPSTTETHSPPRQFSLAVRDRATADEFAELDPQLAELFSVGHELVRNANGPGAAYLIAHAGRELSRGAVQRLLGEGELTGFEEDTEPSEKNRATIGTALGLPPNHVLVSRWFRLNATFAGACHYRLPPPNLAKTRAAFLEFSELLYGRLAPYFATLHELDELLANVEPTTDDVSRAGTLLLRPQQRGYFFSHLKHPRWLRPLAGERYFHTPPELVIEPDERWRMPPWPEGMYLARVAAEEPEQVTALLIALPATLRNPVVWDTVVEAAIALPGPNAAQLVPVLTRALQLAPPTIFPTHALDLVVALAKAGQTSAFALAEALLWTRNAPKGAEETEAARTHARLRSDTEWVLARISTYDLYQFCGTGLPALEALDPLRALKLIARSLNRVASVIVKAFGEDLQDSRRWCEYLDGRNLDSDEDVRAILAVALAGLLKRIASHGQASAEAAWQVLAGTKSEIFERLRYVLVARAGVHLQSELDRLVGGDQLLDPPFGARESAELLRLAFDQASPRARALFRESLERGPGREELRSLVEHRRSTPVDREPSDVELSDALSAWQRPRLRWFHDRIPAELATLAERVGLSGRVPSEEQQALDEVGFFHGGVGYVTDKSPKSAQELASVSTDELVAFVASWRPERPSGFDAPSRRGLENALTEFAAQSPTSAVEMLQNGTSAPAAIPPGAMAAVLTGIATAVKDGKELPWPEVLDAVLKCLEAASRVDPRGDVGRTARETFSYENGWRLVVSAVADIVSWGCGRNQIPWALTDMLWRIAATATKLAIVWQRHSEETECQSLQDAVIASLNTAGGAVASMILEVGLWAYRALGEKTSDRVSEVETHVAPLLDHVLSQRGRPAQGALARLGEYFAQLYLIAPRWTPGAEERLLEGGTDEPARHPVWGVYVTRSKLYDTTFQHLRPWYARAAASAKVPEHGPDVDSEWTVEGGLAVHVQVAFMRGLATLGDADALVENAFSNLAVKHRGYAYHHLFRGWNDSRTPIPSELIGRLETFWEWRLLQLERDPDSPESMAEAKELMWFFLTLAVLPQIAIRLGKRTIALDKAVRRTGTSAWSRLAGLAAADPVGTFDLTEALVLRELGAECPYLPYDELAGPLAAALASGDGATNKRAERLIHRLGERGYVQFRALLQA